MKEGSTLRDEDGRMKLYADIAHPINSSCREMIQCRVIEAFEQEKSQARLPGYVSTYDDFDEEQAMAEVREVRPVAVEPARVQPAEKPHGPHRPPAPLPQAASRPAKEFGAGIFD